MTVWNKTCSLAEATFLVLAAEMALRTVSPRKLFRSLQRKSPIRTRPAPPDAERLAGFVEIADRYVPGTSSCLRRAVALCYLLRRHGVSADLCIGVRRERDALHAHAWVRTDGGRAFGLTETQGYAPLSRISR